MTIEPSIGTLRGHRPELFRGQRGRILSLLFERRGTWVPAPELARIALQYASRIYDIRKEGFVVENHVERSNGQVHGAYMLIGCPEETSQLPLTTSESQEWGGA
jgi:hypothetical protein